MMLDIVVNIFLLFKTSTSLGGTSLVFDNFKAEICAALRKALPPEFLHDSAFRLLVTCGHSVNPESEIN